MDDVLSQILDACELARELDASIRLSAVPIDPHYLSSSCENIAAAFNRAALLIHSVARTHLPPPPPPSPPYTSQMFFCRPPSRMDSDAAGDQGGGPLRSPSSSYQRAIDLLQTAEDDISNNPFYAPQLALGIQSGDPGRIGSAEGGSSGRQVEGLGGSSSSALAQQRPSRKRKEGTVTKRVPALRTSNMDIPPDDGYTWRKYGQKDILNSIFPRSYYRCTHKSYYGCEAKKQVQRLDEDPYTFEVTYRGTHTCQTSPTPILIPTQLLPPAGAADASDDDASLMQLEPMQQQPPAAAASQPTSPSIQLHNWLESSNRMSLGTLLAPRGGVSGAAGSSSRQGGGHAQQGGRDVESASVAELADAMFNSASSGSSMDAIFSPRNGN